MFQMSKVADKAKSFGARAMSFVKASALALVGVVGLAASTGQAMAQSALTTEATSQLASAETDITAILVILIGVVFLFVLYALIKKAK